MKRTQLPVGRAITEPTGYGIQVQLDVNNSDLEQALGDDDIQQVLDRATSLWPNELLEYLQEVFRRKEQ